MKLILLSLLLSFGLVAQVSPIPNDIRVSDLPGSINNNFNWVQKFTTGTALPSTCLPATGTSFYNTSTHVWYDCTALNTFTQRGSGSGGSATAGGDLTGTYPNPTLAGNSLSLSSGNFFKATPATNFNGFILDGIATSLRGLTWTTGGVLRNRIFMGNTESGSGNTGANMTFEQFDDSGNFLANAMIIDRATSHVLIGPGASDDGTESLQVYGTNGLKVYGAFTVTGFSSLGNVIFGGTKFTASGCSNSATVGGSSVGRFTSGTTGTCTVVLTVTGGFAANGYVCQASNLTTTANQIIQTGSSTNGCTVSGTTVSGDVINFMALAY